MRRIFMVALLTLIVGALIFAGCAGPAPAPAPLTKASKPHLPRIFETNQGVKTLGQSTL